jgi:predicted DNA-binding helix-hairpin-helix protein
MSLAEPANSYNVNNSNISYHERLSIDKEIFRKKSLSFLSPRDDTSNILSSTKNETIFNKERYQIEISQDGKFAVTFDTGKVHLKHRFKSLLIVKLKKNEPFFFIKKSKPSD